MISSKIKERCKNNFIKMKKERLGKEPICLVWPMIKDRFNIILSAAADKSLYISFPKPASAVFPRTNPCLQNLSGGKSLTLEAPETKNFKVMF